MMKEYVFNGCVYGMSNGILFSIFIFYIYFLVFEW